MAKGLRLSKGFLKEMRRLSKEAKSKRSVGSNAVDPPRGNRQSLAMEMALDDFDASDLDWLSDRRFVKAREDAQALLHEIFDPNYEPWEEVRDDLDPSDLDQSDVDCTEVNLMGGDSQGSFPNGPSLRTLHVGESLLSGFQRENGGSTMENGQCEVGSSTYGTLPSGVDPVVQHNDLGKVGKAMEHFVKRERPSPTVYRRRQKKVIVSRHFLLVDRQFLRDLGKSQKFQFFHSPSQSVVEVKGHEFSKEAGHSEPTSEPTNDVPTNDILMEEESVPLNSAKMEATDSSSQLSCVTFSPMHSEGSSSEMVGCDIQDTATGPLNLRSKRILVFRRDRLERWGYDSGRCPGKRRRKIRDSVKVNDDGVKANPNPARRKRKRIRVIEDSCGDPSTFRAPQRRALF